MSCACVFVCSVCLLSWLPIYKLSHVCLFAHAHVVRKCSARTVVAYTLAASRRPSFEVERIFPEGFLEDSGRNGKKGKYNTPLALYINNAVQYAMGIPRSSGYGG